MCKNNLGATATREVGCLGMSWTDLCTRELIVLSAQKGIGPIML